MEQVQILTSWFSMFGNRVLVALEEKGIKYEYEEEDLLNKSELLLKMNPVHKQIPVLIHNGKPISESLLILEYIDEAWDSKPLLPKAPYDRATARFWADFVDKKFFDAGYRIIWSKDKVEEGKRDMLESLRILEGILRDLSEGGSVPFFGGKNFGFLDIVFIPFASWFHTYECVGNFKIPFEIEYPLVDAWAKKCMERESVKKAVPSAKKTLEFILKVKNQV